MTAPVWSRRPLKSRNTTAAARLAQWLARTGIRPNAISIASVAIAALAAFCLFRQYFLAAAVLIQGRLLCNLLDGMVAIEGGLGSRAGEIYNDLPDRVSDALILVAAGYAAPWPSFARELGWISSLLAVMTAYIRVLGGACGLTQDFGGPMAKPQRMAVMTVACLVAIFDPRALALALMLVIAGSLLTAGLRLRRILRRLERRP